MAEELRPPLDAWPDLAGLPRRVLDGGLINATWAVGAPPRAVLQRINPIFRPEVHFDIEAVTAHLAARGVATPRLIRTRGGDLWTLDDGGACWRMLSWVPGRTVTRLRDPAMARQAGALVGRWHRATSDLEHTFHFTRPGAHDTPQHMATLSSALREHPTHRLRAEVELVAGGILAGWEAWEGRLDMPARLAHGDLKVANIRFGDSGEALALVDLDTVAHLPLDVELGDAWRSWCNPCSEDADETRFDVTTFEAAAAGYFDENPVDRSDREALVAGVERICLELAARFAADALRESYFGWDPAVARTRGDHNLLRARGQLALARSVAAQRREILAAL